MKKEKKGLSKEETIEEALRQIKKEFPDEDLEMHKEVLTDILINHLSPKDAMGFSDRFIEALYTVAYRNFKGGIYDTAIPMLQFLAKLDPRKPRYTAALASCFFMKKDYEKALAMFYLSWYLEPNDPMPLFYAAECYIELKQFWEATIILRATIEKAQKIPQFAILAERAQMTRDSLLKTLQAAEANH